MNKISSSTGALALAVFLGLFLTGCGQDAGPPGAGESLAVYGYPDFDLNFEDLSGPLDALPDTAGTTVRDTIQLIKNGDHTLALTRLSSLNESNPQNSSLRILTSYALLQTGNLVGAFEEAEKAHDCPGRLNIKCWFLGRVALLTGDQAICEREVAHMHKIGQVAEATELESEFSRRFGSELERP